MEARHESQGRDDVSRRINRAGRLDIPGRPHHAATAHQRLARDRPFLRRAETGTQRRRPRWLEYLIGPGRLADEYTRSRGRKVSEIMTADPLTIAEDTP